MNRSRKKRPNRSLTPQKNVYIANPSQLNAPEELDVVKSRSINVTDEQLNDYDRNLLDCSRTQWLFGDWESLVKLARNSIEQHPERAKLALLAAAAHLQKGGGDLGLAREFLRLAKDWGCDNLLIKQVLMAGVHNSLGNAASLTQQHEKARRHFQQAVQSIGGDEYLCGQMRSVRELTRLGLLSQATVLLSQSIAKHSSPLQESGHVPPSGSSCNNIIFFGHHKCGSRFFRETIFKPLAQESCYEIVAYKIKKPPFHHRFCHELDLYNIDFDVLRKKNNKIILLSNAGKDVVDKINKVSKNYRGVHVIRDPRQILVSNYYHHRKGHGIEYGGWIWDQLKEDRYFLQKLPIEDGILYELNHITRHILEYQIIPWVKDDRIYEVKLEDFSENQDKYMEDIGKFLGLSVPIDIDFNKKFENNESTDWRNVFTSTIVNEFKDRYGSLLIRLGYEESFDW